MNFTGFNRQALALLDRLPAFNEAQYAEVRDVLANGVKAPGAALIEGVAKALDPSLLVDRRRSVSPLHSDLRFAKAPAPRYKDHLLLTTWCGAEKKFAPTLWIRIDSTSVGFASGAAFIPEVRARWREAVGGPRGEALAECIKRLRSKHGRHELAVAGDETKTVPKPWPDHHPRADLLRRTAFQIRFRETHPKAIDTPAFAAWCEERLRDLLPVHDWLMAELQFEAQE